MIAFTKILRRALMEYIFKGKSAEKKVKVGHKGWKASIYRTGKKGRIVRIDITGKWPW